MKAAKKLKRKHNLDQLRLHMVTVTVEELSNIHYRITGKNVIDYWPTRSTIYPLGSKCRGFKGTAAEICELANFDW